MLLVVLQGTGEWTGEDKTKECKNKKEAEAFIEKECAEYGYEDSPNVKVYEAKELKWR